MKIKDPGMGGGLDFSHGVVDRIIAQNGRAVSFSLVDGSTPSTLPMVLASILL